MKKWEYLVIHETFYRLSKSYCDFLNEYGKDGWELVVKDGDMWYFKRQICKEVK